MMGPMGGPRALPPAAGTRRRQCPETRGIEPLASGTANPGDGQHAGNLTGGVNLFLDPSFGVIAGGKVKHAGASRRRLELDRHGTAYSRCRALGTTA